LLPHKKGLLRPALKQERQEKTQKPVLSGGVWVATIGNRRGPMIKFVLI
jgi:hypothetical protein